MFATPSVLSVAEPEIVRVPATVAPAIGLVMETVGGMVSTTVLMAAVTAL